MSRTVSIGRRRRLDAGPRRYSLRGRSKHSRYGQAPRTRVCDIVSKTRRGFASPGVHCARGAGRGRIARVSLRERTASDDVLEARRALRRARRRRRRRSSSRAPRARRSRTSTARVYLDFAGGIGCQNTGHGLRAGRRRDPRAGRPLPAPVLHGRHLRAVRRGLPPARRALAVRAATSRSRCSSTRAPRRSRTRSRSRAPRPAGRRSSSSTTRFHGRTLLTMTMTSKVARTRRGFGPFAPEVYRAAAPYPYRGIDTDAAIAGARAPVQARGRRRRRSPASCSSRCRARAASSRCRDDFPRALRELCDAARDPLRRRRGAVRRRPDRAGVGDRALRRRARPARLRQVARRRAAARRVTGRAEVDGRARPRRARRHVRRQPRRVRRRAASCSTRSPTPAFRARAERARRDAARAARRARRARTTQIGEVRGLGPMLALELVATATKAPPELAKATAAARSSAA